MWQPSLTTRFFLALAALAITLIILPAVAMRWSVQRDIVEYVQHKEFSRLQPLKELLGEHWARQRSWQFLRDDPNQLAELIQQSGVNERRRHRWPVPPDHGGHRPPPPVGEMLLQQRLQVLTVDDSVIAGSSPPPAFHVARQALVWQDETIGYLQLHIPPFVRDGLEQRFLSGQLNTLLAITAIAILLALAVAWWLGRGLVKPILSVAGTVRQLAEGNLAARTVVRERDELGQLARDVDRLAETLVANETLRRDMMADVSHEFRTPLALLQGKIEAMQDGVLPRDDSSLASLHDATLRLSRMVDDLYQVALADTGALQLHLQPVNLRELIERALQDAAGQCQAAHIRTSLSGEQGLLVSADSQRLRQVFDNLLHNACRYTDSGGEIQIQLRRDAEMADVLVQDSAPGVPPEALGQLFDRFFRVEGSRSRDAGGSGLGLSVVKAIVQAHGGSVSASASPLGGLAIRIRLPIGAGTER